MKFLISILFLLVLSTNARSAVRTETVEYKQDGAVLEGYLAYDDAAKGTRPGVLVIHEWWGINDYIKKRTEQLAQLGYIAFAADIYGKGLRAKTHEEAMVLAGKYRSGSDRTLLRARAQAGLDVLKKNPLTDAKRVAAIGYCFGGTTVLELARSGTDVAGVVSFHGGLDTPDTADANNIKGKVLALTGADDPHVKPEQVLAFEDEMRKAGVDWYLVAYGNAVHSFTNPEASELGKKFNLPLAYNEKADKESWADMKKFFAELFKK